jgi:hypothetical protein
LLGPDDISTGLYYPRNTGSSLQFCQCLLKVFYFFRFLFFIKLDNVSFFFQTDRLVFYAAGVLLVKLTFGLQRAPVRGNILPAFGSILSGCPSRYTGKDAGGYRSADAGMVLAGKVSPYLVYRDKLARGDPLHNAINFPGRWDNTGTRAPSLAHLLVNFDDFRQTLLFGGSIQLLTPALPWFRHANLTSINLML